MKSTTKMMTLCLLVGGLWTVTGVLAADLPDLGEPSQKQGKTSAMPAGKPLKDLILKEDAKCTECHDEADSPELLRISTTRHGVTADQRNPTCTSCHGDSNEHKDYKGKEKPPKPDRSFIKGTKTSAAERNTACLTCHDKDTKRTHWDGGAHNVNDVACSSCHKIHTAHDDVRDKKTQPEVCFTCHKEQRAESKKMSHHPIGEGKVSCSDCHNAHGSSGPKLLKKNTVVETCYTCHAEKRGPFLFEHRPVTEDCTICHTAHGSNITPLLKFRAPFMCQGCHDAPHQSESPIGPNAAGRQAGLTAATVSSTTTGRACMNCHVLVHGSNSPAGGFWER